MFHLCVPLFHLWMIIYAMNRWRKEGMILFWSIAKHEWILFWTIDKHARILFEVLLNMLQMLLMHVAVFSTLGRLWLTSIQSWWSGRPEIATRGSLLPWVAPLLLPHGRRWEALAAAIPLFLLLHLMTLVWRRVRYLLLLLQHGWMTPPRSPRATMMNVITSKMWAHMNCF
jgi:hypothetical protein